MSIEINEQQNKVIVTESGLEIIEVEGSGISVIEVAQQGPQGPRGEGIPTGGITGQILRKTSESDYETEWATASGTGDMSTSTYDSNTDGIVNRADVADSVEWTDVNNKPATFVPTAHNHPISDVTNLQTSLDGKASSVHTHTEADITNLDKYTQDEVDSFLAAKSDTGHSHTKSDISDFAHTHTEADISDLGNYSVVGHTHTEVEITDLDKYTQSEVDTFLAAKAASSHTHTVSDINSEAATSGYVATADGAGGTSWQAVAGSGDMTKAVYDANDDGKVDEADYADVAPWAGITGKPTTFTPSSHTHTKTDITDFAHTHTESEITDLGNYSAVGHTHTESEITDLGNYAVVGHTHTESDITDLDKYTQAEVTSFLAAKANLNHTHTESEITDLGNYSEVGHNHSIADVTNLQTELNSKLESIPSTYMQEGEDAALLGSGVGSTGYVLTADGAGNTSWQQAPGAGAGSGDMTKAIYDENDDGKVDEADSADTAPWTGITGKPATFPPDAHTHTEAEITDLGNYSVVGHTHAIADVTSLQSSLDSKVDENVAITAGTATKITYDAKGLVTVGGSLIAADIPNLDTAKITTGTFADARIAASNVTQHQSALTITESQISDLGTYLATTDIDTLAELNLILTDANLVDENHTHTESDITDLGNYSIVGHTHTESDITDLGNYALDGHSHTLSDVTDSGTSAALDVAVTGDASSVQVVKGDDTRLSNARTPTAHTHTESEISDLGNYSTVGHTHTESEITDLGNYSTVGHSHTESDITDLDKYTQAEINTFLSGKSNTTHTHTEADITDLGNYSVVGHTHTEAEISDLGNYSLVGHTHTKSDISDFTHTHLISDVTNLQTTLDGKVDDGAVATILGSGAATTDYALLADGAGGTYFGAVSGGGGGSGLTWTEVASGLTATVDQGYITNSASQLIVTLPGSSPIGKTIRIAGKGAGGWRLAQQTGQVIYFGASQTTAGTGGYLESTHQRNGVELICVTANTEWQVVSSVGNITVV